MLADPELVVSAFLRAHTDVTAVVDRIGTRTPKTLDEPWVRITLIDDSPAAQSKALHVTTALLQLDCYGGGDPELAQGEASEIARTIREALTGMPAATHTGAVVTSAKPGSLRRLPDTDLEPARERYILEAVVVMHP